MKELLLLNEQQFCRNVKMQKTVKATPFSFSGLKLYFQNRSDGITRVRITGGFGGYRPC